MKTADKNITRFDTRLPVEQKQLFEKAAMLGGYRNLTDFIISTVQNKAMKIVKEQEKILSSQRDREIFFDSLLNPPKPNDDLVSALNDYKQVTAE